MIARIIRPPLPGGYYIILLLACCVLLPATGVPADEWAGSERCYGCHRDQYASWHRTYHRSMTQTATPETVEGRFDGRPVTYWGATVVPIRRDGAYWFDYYLPGREDRVASYRIERTVGSNVYQQYLTRAEGQGGTYFRLHLLWHIRDRRWVHMNGVFLGPDDQPFDANVTVWNHNCIFCHNTGPEPGVVNYDEMLARAAAGEPVNAGDEARYHSHVAELGIACESCHGPGAEHVAKQDKLLTRWWYTLTGAADDSIVHPGRLDAEAATQVCGQCHGQRIPKDNETLQRFIDDGPVYRPGDDLFESVELVWPDTRLPTSGHAGDLFRLRFWDEGTPRLTAYEYQGLLLSECHTQGGMTCMNCHAMHDGDIQGMIPDSARGNEPCLACHQDLAEDVTAHTRHPAGSPGSTCYNCHMPEIVYGVMDIHRSHHIENPRPAAHAAAGRPNACNLCHLDRSAAWAEEQTARLWGGRAESVNRADGLAAETAGGIAGLYAGDPVVRAVTAVAVDRALQAGYPSPRAWKPHLLNAMSDNYPAIRRFAARALRRVSGELADELEAFDFIAAEPDRTAALERLIRHWSRLEHADPPPEGMWLTLDWQPVPDVARLREIGERRSEEVSIGE